MPKEYGRNERIADQIRRDLAELLLYEVKDPRLQSITISEVLIDRDLNLARVLISAASEAESREPIESLERANGFLRSKLARRLRLRSVPKLRFEFDSLSEHASRIESLLAGVDPDRESINEIDEAESEPGPDRGPDRKLDSNNDRYALPPETSGAQDLISGDGRN